MKENERKKSFHKEKQKQLKNDGVNTLQKKNHLSTRIRVSFVTLELRQLKFSKKKRKEFVCQSASIKKVNTDDRKKANERGDQSQFNFDQIISFVYMIRSNYQQNGHITHTII